MGYGVSEVVDKTKETKNIPKDTREEKFSPIERKAELTDGKNIPC